MMNNNAILAIILIVAATTSSGCVINVELPRSEDMVTAPLDVELPIIIELEPIRDDDTYVTSSIVLTDRGDVIIYWNGEEVFEHETNTYITDHHDTYYCVYDLEIDGGNTELTIYDDHTASIASEGTIHRGTWRHFEE